MAFKFLISSTWKTQFYDSSAVCDDIKDGGFGNAVERIVGEDGRDAR